MTKFVRIVGDIMSDISIVEIIALLMISFTMIYYVPLILVCL